MKRQPDPDSPASTDPAPSAGEALRAGSVPYLNAAPLVRGLEGRLRLLPPAQLAVALRTGEIDAALLSVTEALLGKGYAILDGPCVASDGEVYSVILAHRRPLRDADTIHCHAASLTSVNLLRVLLAEQGIRPDFQPLADPALAREKDFVLLIGDPAIRFQLALPEAPEPRPAVWDLGAAWQRMTGLPFVYAAWVLRTDVDTRALRTELRAAAIRGQHELEDIIVQGTEFDAAFRRRYLTQHTRHVLGTAEKAGLELFTRLLRRHGLPAHEPRYHLD